MAAPDIAAQRVEPGAVLGGFEHRISIDGRPGETIRIEVDVTDLDGRVGRLKPVDVTITAGTPSGPSTPSRPLSAGEQPGAEVAIGAGGGRERMAVFTHRLDLGGGQLYLQDPLRPLLAEHDVTCLEVSQYDGPLRRAGAPRRRRGGPRLPRPPAAAHERQVDLIADLVRDHGSNIVLANTMSAGIGPDVARRLGLPVIWAIHESYCLDDFWVAAYGDDGIAAPVRSSIRRALASTAAAVLRSRRDRAAYRGRLTRTGWSRFPTESPSAELTSSGPGTTAPAPPVTGLDPHATVLLCIGTFEARKAQAALALALAEVAPTNPDAVLALVGDIGTPYALGPEK